MKMFALPLAFIMLACGVAHAQESPKKHVHLWEEDSHFCYYRVLQIEGQLSSIQRILKDLDHNNSVDVKKRALQCEEHLKMIDILLGNRGFEELSSPDESATEK